MTRPDHPSFDSLCGSSPDQQHDWKPATGVEEWECSRCGCVVNLLPHVRRDIDTRPGQKPAWEGNPDSWKDPDPIAANDGICPECGKRILAQDQQRVGDHAPTCSLPRV